jgi:DNA primase
MNQRIDIDNIKERVKEYLPSYLSSMGRAPSINGKSFRCINPDHSDSNPSCSIIPNTDDRLFHCFSCNITGDIFLAAHFLEDKPLSGRGFISDNLIYLANKYGIEVPELNLTEDELYEMDVFRAYSDAASIIKSNTCQSDRVKVWFTDRGWLDHANSALRKIGVGSVESFEIYCEKMTKQYGHKMEFLDAIDLTRKGIFNADCIIFTVKDEHGSPVGFAGRNLRYEEQHAAYDKARKDILATESEESEKLKDLFKPSKYINTSEKCPIYQKSRRLFNFNLAKKFTPPLYVFEGYSDVVTLYTAGLKNCVSIGSTAFSKDHLELILGTEPPVKHIVFVLDADKAGDKGTERFVDLLESAVGGHVGLRTEIIIMPEGSDDPDSYVRKFPSFEAGLHAFRQLERIDIFTWKLRQGMKAGQDPLTLAEQAIPLIVNESNFLLRMDMTQKLAKATGLDKEGLWREVMRMVDSDASRIDEEKSAIAKRTVKEIGRNTKDLQAILASALHQTEMVEKRRTGYDPMSNLKAFEYVEDKAAKAAEGMELLTGFAKLDEAIGGLPKEECFISLPGKPNQGKSTFLDNLTVNLLDRNKDCIVFFHTVDDALGARIPRIKGAKYSYPSKYFKKSGYFLKNLGSLPSRYRDFEEVNSKASAWMSNLINSERLILADVAGLPPQLPALEQWIRTIRMKFPNKSLVVMGDNFHLYDLPGWEPGEAKTREMSMFVKRMTTEHHCTILMTCELPKGSMKAGTRPRLSNIKGTSGVAYDANCNFGIYNDMKDRGDKITNVYWEDFDAINDHVGVDSSGGDIGAPKRPILEVVIDKSKISDFDGSIYYRLDPVTGHVDECAEGEQELYSSRSYPHDQPTGE